MMNLFSCIKLGKDIEKHMMKLFNCIGHGIDFLMQTLSQPSMQCPSLPADESSLIIQHLLET